MREQAGKNCERIRNGKYSRVGSWGLNRKPNNKKLKKGEKTIGGNNLARVSSKNKRLKLSTEDQEEG